MKQIPDCILIGKDAADAGFAFNKLEKAVYSFGLMSNLKTDKIKFLGATFIDLLKFLYSQ